MCLRLADSWLGEIRDLPADTIQAWSPVFMETLQLSPHLSHSPHQMGMGTCQKWKGAQQGISSIISLFVSEYSSLQEMHVSQCNIL